EPTVAHTPKQRWFRSSIAIGTQLAVMWCMYRPRPWPITSISSWMYTRWFTGPACHRPAATGRRRRPVARPVARGSGREQEVRDQREVAQDRCDHQRVEDLVESEELGPRVGPLACIHDGADRVEDSPGG